MTWILRIVAAWGIADSLFLAFMPRRWSRWWGRWITRIGDNAVVPRLIALLELGLSLFLLSRGRGTLAREQYPAAVQGTPSGSLADRAMVRVKRSGPLLIAFRAPLWLYRLGLGWMLGHRFLLLTHRGRKSGQVRQTVLEVVHYDPRTRESVVVSGWGKRADWYRNIQANPPIEVQTGHDRFTPTYRELSPDENYPIVEAYVRGLPRFARPMVQRLGFSVEGTEEERRDHAAHLLMIGFRRRSDSEATHGAAPGAVDR